MIAQINYMAIPGVKEIPINEAVTLRKLVTYVSEVKGVNVRDLKSTCRLRELSDARWLYFLMARVFTNCSLRRIGEEVNRDHATVLYGSRKLYSLFDVYQDERISFKSYVIGFKKRYQHYNFKVLNDYNLQLR